MRADHIDSFNTACKSVSKLALEAIAEHRRQIAQLATIMREAAALADASGVDTVAAAPWDVAASQQVRSTPASIDAVERRDARHEVRGQSDNDGTPSAALRTAVTAMARTPVDNTPSADILKIAMRRASASPFAPPNGRVVGSAALAMKLDEVEEEDPIGLARPPTLTAPRDGVADDLQSITGIGARNEMRLNSLGIFHFDQIAAWSPGEVRWVAQKMAFPDRVEHDDWVGQAAALVGNRAWTSAEAENGSRSNPATSGQAGPSPAPSRLKGALLRVIGSR